MQGCYIWDELQRSNGTCRQVIRELHMSRHKVTRVDQNLCGLRVEERLHPPDLVEHQSLCEEQLVIQGPTQVPGCPSRRHHVVLNIDGELVDG